MNRSLPIFLLILFLGFISVSPASERVWTSGDGRQITGEPVNKTTESVTIRVANGDRHTIPVKQLIEADRKFVEGWLPKRPFNVPEDAVFHEGSWFAIFRNHKVSRPVAAAHAKRMGGHLAYVKTIEIQKVVQKLAGGSQVWIGGSDREVEGLWKWGDGEKFDFTYWSKGEPTNYRGREDYVHLLKSGRWNDNDEHSGTALVGYIVQWQL